MEFNVQVLTAKLGSVGNPQRSVVGVRYQYQAGAFRFTCGPDECNGSGQPPSAALPFPIRSTVTFVDVSGTEPQQVVPPAPLLFPPLPNDIFYPFTVGSVA